ncbi:MAG: Ger(x)C family spore germination protein [Acetivibrionales bacterium]
MNKRIFILVLLLSTSVLSGCWDQKIFEETGFVLQVGLELNENDDLVLSLTMPVVEEEIEQNVEILSATAPLIREARDKIRNFSGKRIEGGKTQQLHFSRELAEKGVGDLLDVFFRSPENPVLANITVVEGSPLEMFKLSLNYKDKTRVAFYVTHLIDESRKRTASPDVRIYDFAIAQHCGTIDPTAVHMRYDEEKIEILGTALFQGDRMVGNIDIVDTGILYALMGKKIRFDYYCRENHTHQPGIKSGMALLFKKVKRKVDIDVSGEKPKIHISLDYITTLDEYDDKHQLDEPNNKKELEAKVTECMKNDCERLLAYLQEVGADPVGFAEMVRSKHNAYFKSIDWRKIYPEIEFTVDVKVTIESQGAIN